MYPHRIRLHGPWQCELVLAPPSTPTVGSEDGVSAYQGNSANEQTSRYRRRFGYPGRIDEYERVWLTFSGVDGPAQVWLNGQFLGRHGTGGTFEFEVTALLERRNELVVELTSATVQGRPFGAVAMEIRCAAFLRALRAWPSFEGENAYLHVSGEVGGSCDRPLELYVLLDGSTVIYAMLEAKAAGQEFHLISEALEPARRQRQEHILCIDLVNAASIWHREERVLHLGA